MSSVSRTTLIPAILKSVYKLATSYISAFSGFDLVSPCWVAVIVKDVLMRYTATRDQGPDPSCKLQLERRSDRPYQ